MNEWQPIKTAPKDGTDVLVLYDIASVAIAHIAWYRSEEQYARNGGCDDEAMEEYVGWWSYVENSVGQWKLNQWREPLYWMPLPKLPEGIG